MLRKRLKEMEDQMRGKEELIRELERDKENQAALQQQYASVLTALRQEVEEKEHSVTVIQKQRGRTEEERRAIAIQLEQVSSELIALKELVKEHKTAMKRVQFADKKIEQLAEELRRSKAERAAVAQQIKRDVSIQKQREKEGAEEIARLKAQSEASYRMVRQLKLQVQQQSQLMANKQAELDAMALGPRNINPGVGSGATQTQTPPRSRSSLGGTANRPGSASRRNSPAPAQGVGSLAISRASVKSLQRQLTKEVSQRFHYIQTPLPARYTLCIYDVSYREGCVYIMGTPAG
jgi:hypothetical protein